MPSAFRDFSALDRAAVEGVDYRRELRRTGSGVAHIAVHGGGIEAGTAEAADAVARRNGQDYYAFVGLREVGNGALHITSVHFDEPQCEELQRSARATVSYHGCAGERPIVHLGGGDQDLRRRIGEALADAGFTVDWHTAVDLDGSDRRNICNRNASGAGVQLELSTALRASFFPDGRTSRARRESGRRTDVFERFVTTVAAVTATAAAVGTGTGTGPIA
jgi:phage replication-related protein YjqB (UPF0714/DUF867 family)